MLWVLTDPVIIKQNLTNSSQVKTTTDLMACQNKTKTTSLIEINLNFCICFTNYCSYGLLPSVCGLETDFTSVLSLMSSDLCLDSHTDSSILTFSPCAHRRLEAFQLCHQFLSFRVLSKQIYRQRTSILGCPEIILKTDEKEWRWRPSKCFSTCSELSPLSLTRHHV